MTLPNIGLVGRKQTGKSTAATLLVEDYGYQPLAFADPLRAMAKDIDPIVEVETESRGSLAYQSYEVAVSTRYAELVDYWGYDVAKESVGEVRQFLQRLGVAARDHLGPDVWVDALLRRMDSLPSLPGWPLVVTDVRFANEAAALRSRGFVLVRLTRSAAPAGDSHVSETEGESIVCDLSIENEDSLDDLRDALSYAVRELGQ